MWETFNQRHESGDSAFEALCCQLFERWCRREYGDSIRSFYFLEGSGGDGGVEAFAILNDGSVVGLQAKAWWEGFLNSQKGQVERSLQAATTRHSTLVRYLVCCPLNLGESKGRSNSGTSQRERWQAFEVEARANHPGVTLEYKGETGIREWLQQPDSETIRAYWFDGIVIPRDHWRTQFERVKSTWLDHRYVPDLHVSTILDEGLSWFANSDRAAKDLRERISWLATSLEQKRERISNLGNLPGDHSSQALSDSASLVEAIDSSLENLRLLDTAVQSQALPTIAVDSSTDCRPQEAASRLLDELGGRRRLTFALSPANSVIDAVKGLLENLQAVRALLGTQQRLRLMLLVLGDAGTGKTQTITKLCDIASREGVPVLVLPARAFNPRCGWSETLGQASSRPNWTAEQILDALEASSLFAWRASPESRHGPRRAILVLDGPDESPDPASWNERIKELADLCKSRPLIAPIVTTRPESSVWLQIRDARFHLHHLSTPDIADRLPEIFQEYVREYHITVPSPTGVAWALKTPLSIRLFAEVYQGCTIAPGQDFVTSLAELFKLKLKRLDEELNARDRTWPMNRDLSLGILGALVPAFLKHTECSYEHFAKAVLNCLKSLGLAPHNSTALFEKSAREHGLIEVYRSPTGGMMPDEVIVRPGFNALLDYILADRIAARIRRVFKTWRPDFWLLVKVRRHFPKLDRHTRELAKEVVFPNILHGRQNCQSLVVASLLKEGLSLIDAGIWRPFVDEALMNEYHARGIGDLRPDRALAYKSWASALLCRDMVSCRMLVAELILPSSRIPGSLFGADFLHEEFSRMNLTDRDLVWSGPDWLPANCGGPWEGHGVPVHDSITLRDDDSATTVPILAAWVTSSVIHQRQRQAIARLAKWGSNRPAELANLLLNFGSADDVQVVESVVVAAAGAVLKLVEHGSADDLANAAHKIFFTNRDEKDHPSVVARHAARLVIERAFVIGTDLPEAVRGDATPPYPPVGANLGIDAETVALAAGEGRGGGNFPLSSDLDWHVAPMARDPFFQYTRPHTEEMETRRYAEVPKDILDAVADGRLEVEPTVLQEIAEEIELRSQTQPFLGFTLHELLKSSEACEVIDEEPLCSAEDEEETSDPRSLEELLEAIGSRSSFPPQRLSNAAEAMLADYAHEAGSSEALTPKQLGNGLIASLLKTWGWNSKTFYGEPRGGEPGEILGADIAILRQHHQATHGSRSSVAMFGEKYVWSAVNVVSSFLSDRLPGKDLGGENFEMITNQSGLGSRTPDPLAGDLPDAVPQFRPPWNPAGIAPVTELSETRQPDRGIQWLELADWPDPADWFAADPYGSIVLNGFLSTKEHAIGIQIAVWVSCIAVPRTKVHLLERDVAFAPRLWTSYFSIHDVKGNFGEGVYSPPRLAVWAPWVTDGETMAWHTLSDSGQPTMITLLPLVTATDWVGTEGETSALSPTKLLRLAGGIIDCCGPDNALQFVGRDRIEVAYFQRFNSPDDWSKSNTHLQMERSNFFRSLAEQDCVPVWGVRIYRELLPELRPDGWVDKDSYWLVVSEDGGANFRSVLASRQANNKS